MRRCAGPRSPTERPADPGHCRPSGRSRRGLVRGVGTIVKAADALARRPSSSAWNRRRSEVESRTARGRCVPAEDAGDQPRGFPPWIGTRSPRMRHAPASVFLAVEMYDALLDQECGRAGQIRRIGRSRSPRAIRLREVDGPGRFEASRLSRRPGPRRRPVPAAAATIRRPAPPARPGVHRTDRAGSYLRDDTRGLRAYRGHGAASRPLISRLPLGAQSGIARSG